MFNRDLRKLRNDELPEMIGHMGFAELLDLVLDFLKNCLKVGQERSTLDT